MRVVLVIPVVATVCVGVGASVVAPRGAVRGDPPFRFLEVPRASTQRLGDVSAGANAAVRRQPPAVNELGSGANRPSSRESLAASFVPRDYFPKKRT